MRDQISKKKKVASTLGAIYDPMTRSVVSLQMTSTHVSLWARMGMATQFEQQLCHDRSRLQNLIIWYKEKPGHIWLGVKQPEALAGEQGGGKTALR